MDRDQQAFFKVQVNAIGRGTMLINGVDLSSQIRGFHVQAEHNEPTAIYLQLIPGAAELEGEGIVYVTSEDSLRNFLDQLDPIVVKARALENLTWGEGDPIIAAVEVIKHLAREYDGD